MTAVSLTVVKTEIKLDYILTLSPYRAVTVIKTSQLMLYREINAVCSEIHTKHINPLCGQNAEFQNVKMVVHIFTTGLQRVHKSFDFFHSPGSQCGSPYQWWTLWH